MSARSASMEEFSAMASSSSSSPLLQQQDRFSTSSPSLVGGGGDLAGQRPRRHLPSPALAQAKSLLKLNSKQAFAHSFDVSELSGLHLSSGDGGNANSMASSPSAPVVSSACNFLLAGRRLPVPVGSSLSTLGVTDAMDEMDALINRGSSSNLMSAVGKVSSLSSPSSSSSALSSRKLPAPPVSAAALAMQNHSHHHPSRRLLPRPLSCDVPTIAGDTDLLSGLSGFLAPLSRSGGAHLLSNQQRPYSFDYAPPDLELDGSALELDDYGTVGGAAGGGSDPSLILTQEKPTGGLYQRGSLVRQSSTTSCPALVRPCVSPRSPKFRSDVLGSGASGGSFSSLSFNGASGGGGASSGTTTPSPHPSYPPTFVTPDPPCSSSSSSFTTAYLSTPGTFVPLQQLSPLTPPPNALSPTPSHQHLSPSSTSSSPYTWQLSHVGAVDSNLVSASAAVSTTIVTIPSAGSAFRPPPSLGLQMAQPRHSASLPPTLLVDGVHPSENGLILRRLRYQQTGGGGSGVGGCGGGSGSGRGGNISQYMSIQEYSHHRLDLRHQQRTSRSRAAARNSMALTGR